MAKKKKKISTPHVIDGICYKHAHDIVIHKELGSNPLVKTFKLPNKKEKSTYSRYGSHKCEINGLTFDSVMEGRFYAYLLTVEHEGALKKVETQVKYTLVEGFTHKLSKKKIRPITYIADFVITYPDDVQVVIDVKGKKTPEFKIKEKLFYKMYPNINFICVQYDEKAKEWRNLDDIEKDRRARKRAKAKSSS